MKTAKAVKPAITKLPNTLGIKLYMHCKLCIDELPAGIAPVTYARLSVGFTDEGLQIWCDRHSCNVAHIHFEGQSHPANMSREALPEETRPEKCQ